MMYPTIYLGRKSMINKFLAIISDQVNIRFAWEKVKNYILSGDYWFDELDLASFELNLEDNLKIISESFLKMKYRLSPIKPLPFPKTSDIKGKEKLRQIFYISIIDQVAWVAFVKKEYWERKLDISKGDKQLYWCSIDFKKFYPSIKLDIIKKTILANLPKNCILYAEKLLNCLLDFKIFIDDDSLDFVKDINIRKNSKSYNHLPTGLYVSGFLANVAMLNIDNIIGKELDRYNIAHFRFVDDH